MTDHLPECPSFLCRTPAFECCACHCSALRACEARVLGDHEEYNRGYDAALRAYQPISVTEAYDNGYTAALDAARDAVAALGHVVDCMWSHEEDLPCPHEEALAAIDALRGES